MYRFRFTHLLLMAGMLLSTSLSNLYGKDSVESIITQMVDARMQRSTELRDWENEKRKVGDLIYLYQEELGRIDEQLATSHLQQNEQQSNVEIYRAEITDYESRLAEVRKLLDQWEPAAAQLVALVPASAKREILQDLEAATGDHDPASLVNRTSRLCMTMQKLNEFHNRISHISELHPLPDGRQIEVQVLYAGFSYAWFANESAAMAGYGVPVGDAWQWKNDPALLPQVLKALATANSNEPSTWTELPVTLNSTEQP